MSMVRVREIKASSDLLGIRPIPNERQVQPGSELSGPCVRLLTFDGRFACVPDASP